MIQISEQVHEGDLLRELVDKSGKTQEEFASMLGIVRQTLIYHMRKPQLSDDFKKLLRDAGIDITGANTKADTVVTKGQIHVNVMLKNQRWAQFILPPDLRKEDLEILMDQIKLMLKSMEK